MIREYFTGIWCNRYILMSLVNQDLQRKYKRSVLGVAWAILTPLGLVLIIGSVYSIIFNTDPKQFIPLLFTGLNPWIFMNASADGGTGSLLGAEGYLKQTTVNMQIFPLRTVMVAFINLLYSLLAFIAVYLFLQPTLFGPIMLLAIPGLLLIFLFSLALANISSIANLYIRDFQPLQSLILQGMFYVTPIIFQPEMLKDRGFAILYMINPFYYLIEVVRRPILGESIPTLSTYIIAFFITGFVFIVSIIVLMKRKKSIAFKF